VKRLQWRRSLLHIGRLPYFDGGAQSPRLLGRAQFYDPAAALTI